MSKTIDTYRIKTQESIDLLSGMIEIQSFSREEELVSDYLASFFKSKGLNPLRSGNNIWLKSVHWDESKPTILLNSHIDTVKPATSYSLDPFKAHSEGWKAIWTRK